MCESGQSVNPHNNTLHNNEKQPTDIGRDMRKRSVQCWTNSEIKEMSFLMMTEAQYYAHKNNNNNEDKNTPSQHHPNEKVRINESDATNANIKGSDNEE